MIYCSRIVIARDWADWAQYKRQKICSATISKAIAHSFVLNIVLLFAKTFLEEMAKEILFSNNYGTAETLNDLTF